MLDAKQIGEVLGLPVELVAQLIKDRAKSSPTRLVPETTRVAYAEYVRIAKAAELTGYTERAINAKIDGGVWAYGDVWMFTPLGERVIIMKGYHRWVESGRAAPPVKRRASSKARPAP
jgi:hypothetical protein